MIGLPARGRPGISIMLSVGRHLTAADLLRLQTEESPKVAAPMLQKLKAWHHNAARLVASGRPLNEIALATGYTAQRISDLKTDQLFNNLVAYYREQIAETGIDDAQRLQTKLIDTAETALDEIQTRLDDPDQLKAIPTGELRQIAAMGLDRTVAPAKQALPPTQAPIKVTFKMGPRDIRPTVDITPTTEDKE